MKGNPTKPIIKIIGFKKKGEKAVSIVGTKIEVEPKRLNKEEKSNLKLPLAEILIKTIQPRKGTNHKNTQNNE